MMCYILFCVIMRRYVDMMDCVLCCGMMCVTIRYVMCCFMLWWGILCVVLFYDEVYYASVMCVKLRCDGHNEVCYALFSGMMRCFLLVWCIVLCWGVMFVIMRCVVRYFVVWGDVLCWGVMCVMCCFVLWWGYYAGVMCVRLRCDVCIYFLCYDEVCYAGVI